MRILAGDIGGTKTLLTTARVEDGDLQILDERRYDSEQFASLEAIIREFERTHTPRAAAICMAVAGPVEHGRAHLTNLGWNIDEVSLGAAAGGCRALLVNDFWAVARGVPLLGPGHVVPLSDIRPDRDSPIAILGAGTGLGEAIVIPSGGGWRIVASEGGHCDFAPIGPLQRRLHEFLERELGHVSYERVVSGPGIANIYRFLLADQGSTAETLEADAIARRADQGDETAAQALDLFVEIFGAEAGNMALKVLAHGGVYIAGGIAPRHLERFRSGRFMAAFNGKGRFEPVMKKMPVHIISEARVGLIGALEVAREMALR